VACASHPAVLPGSAPERGRTRKIDHNLTQALEPDLLKAMDDILAPVAETDPARTAQNAPKERP
ncbi:hypothetical protein AB0P35_27435, partial [Kitasatospora sp. NPDC085879]